MAESASGDASICGARLRAAASFAARSGYPSTGSDQSAQNTAGNEFSTSATAARREDADAGGADASLR